MDFRVGGRVAFLSAEVREHVLTKEGGLAGRDGPGRGRGLSQTSRRVCSGLLPSLEGSRGLAFACEVAVGLGARGELSRAACPWLTVPFPAGPRPLRQLRALLSRREQICHGQCRWPGEFQDP